MTFNEYCNGKTGSRVFEIQCIYILTLYTFDESDSKLDYLEAWVSLILSIHDFN